MTAIELIQSVLPGAQPVVSEDKPPSGCDWPTCLVVGPLISLDDEGSWWCMVHVSDDVLPGPLVSGPLGYCARCDGPTAAWLDQTPMHAGCLREWAMGRVSLRPKGAYARRTS